MKYAYSARLLAVLTVVTVALLSPPASAGIYDQMVVFGDSLSDSGNNASPPFNLYDPAQVITGDTYVPSNTYAPNKTYSNGPVWASDAAAALGVPLTPSLQGGTNYAFGGATTGTDGPGPFGFPFSLLTQATQYLTSTGHVADPNALYVVAGGGNDARAALAAIGGGAAVTPTVTATAASFASNIATIVTALNAAGAKHIVVWDAPNLGLAPAVRAGGAGAIALGTGLAQAMNQALGLALAGDTDVTTFDLFGLGTSIATNPGLYGFTDVKHACGAIALADCSKYAYWDGIHPTAAAHQVIAEAFLAIASPVPEPSTWALMIAGFVVIAFAVRRRTASAATVAA